MRIWLAIAIAFGAPLAKALNVTDFGAVGDAVQSYASSTSNSVVIVTTNTFSSADLGKAIEVFDAGAVTSAPECQDLISTITNIINGTNLYISALPQRTISTTFITVGHDNRTNFLNALTAANGPATTIDIPAGKYLILSTNVPNVFGTINAGIALYQGGLHFVGSGTNETVLLGQGAWTLKSGAATRGMLFALGCPITNDFPVVLQDLTLDGGVPDGNTSNHSFPASVTTGDGWDTTHDALEIFGAGGQMWSNLLLTNVLITHWRGEMLKSTDGSTNGNLIAVNCTFADGNATALNIYAALTITNCIFRQLHEVAEYYQAYSTNTSLFQNNFTTNMTGALFAINGAITNHPIPGFNIISNTFYLVDQNGIQTTPAQNLTIYGNRFLGVSANGGNPVVLGTAGYQGTAVNSNIVVSGNLFSNVFSAVSVAGTGANLVKDVVVSDNTGILTFQFGLGTGWSTNVSFIRNTTSGSALDSHNGAGQYFRDSFDNSFPQYVALDHSQTNRIVNYGYGQRWQIGNSGPDWYLDDSHPEKIPSGAVLVLTNSSANNYTLWQSLVDSRSVLLGAGTSVTNYWSGTSWLSFPISVIHIGTFLVRGSQ